MTTDEHTRRFTGGCLCGALRYEATGEPLYMGLCFCVDCQKASGSGFIPFIGVAGSAVRFRGPSQQHVAKAARGGDSHRNFCPTCGGLVFGGERDRSESFQIYAGSLDDPSLFAPRMVIFASQRPHWAVIPPGVTTVFERMPP